MAEAFKSAAWAKNVCELLPKGSGLGCRLPGSQVKWIYCVHKSMKSSVYFVCKINLRFLCIWCYNNNRVSPKRNPMWITLKHLTSDIIKHRPSNLHAWTSLQELRMVQRETHLTPIKVSMVRTTSNKQISRTFKGFFKDKLQSSRTKIYSLHYSLTPVWTPYWLKHVMESSTIFPSSASVDHIILYFFPQQRFGKWLGMTWNCSKVQKQHLK